MKRMMAASKSSSEKKHRASAQENGTTSEPSARQASVTRLAEKGRSGGEGRLLQEGSES